MFIMSLKISNKIKKILMFLLFSLLIGLIIIFNIYKNANKITQSQLSNPISFNGKTNKNRINFFKQYGWETSNEPSEISDVVIPQHFDDVFEEYNNIQKKQNMDLKKYKGKVVKHYSYEINNYPNHPNNIRGNLLVYEGQIIAVDICSLDLEGFMHGISK